jgi:hypothetical protein
MARNLKVSLVIVVLAAAVLLLPIGIGEEQSYLIPDDPHHTDHLNDDSDDYPNDYTPLIVPVDVGKWITVAPVITCTSLENESWHPCYHPCKMAQTIMVDGDWSDDNATYSYIFEDWIDFDWNDIIVNLQASISQDILSAILLVSREAMWENPLGLEVTAEGTWIVIEWNSTEHSDTQQLTIDEGDTAEINLFDVSDQCDKAFLRFLIPPAAAFSWQPPQPYAGGVVVFDASASYDVDRAIQSYAWLFDNDRSVRTEHPTITHVFSTSGAHVVSLTITDDDGLTDTICKTISVGDLVGGETASLDYTRVSTWRPSSVLLILGFIFAATLVSRKKHRGALEKASRMFKSRAREIYFVLRRERR